MFDDVPGVWYAALCEALEPLEGVVDEDPVLVRRTLLLLLRSRGP